MNQYVNQEALFQWYESVRKDPEKGYNRQALLNRLYEDYCRTGEAKFTLPAAETATGQPESYEYRFENLGCCGASTHYFYF